MSPEKVRTLDDFIERLRSVPNLVGVVPGGSYARGLARPESDLDIGLYYRDASPFPFEIVRSVAESVCIPGSI